jgi:hypothetical protein
MLLTKLLRSEKIYSQILVLCNYIACYLFVSRLFSQSSDTKPMDIGNSRLTSHYGQNDAREVRRREKAEEVESALPYDSVWDKIGWYLVTLVLLGVPNRYLRRINNVARKLRLA